MQKTTASRRQTATIRTTAPNGVRRRNADACATAGRVSGEQTTVLQTTLLTLPADTSAVEDHWPDDAHTSHKRGSDNCTDQKKDRWQTTHSNGATDEAHP